MMGERILKYKLEKLLASNPDIKPKDAAKALGLSTDGPYQYEPILHKLAPESFADPYEIKYNEPRPATMDDLIAYVTPMIKLHGIQYLVNFNRLGMGGPCGCMGPQDGEPLCPCDMQAEVAAKKNDILVALTARQQAS